MSVKLIRDKIPEIIKESGASANISQEPSLSFSEEVHLLHSKLIEETAELIMASQPFAYKADKAAEEMADIIEVILALADVLLVDRTKIEKTRLSKLEKRGGFSKKHLLCK